MHIFNLFRVQKNMTVKEIINFKIENYYSRTGHPKENSYYLMKRQKS